MRPIAVLSVDNNPDYLACLPFVCKSWQLQGFDIGLMVQYPAPKIINVVLDYIHNIFDFFPFYPVMPTIKNKKNPALGIQCSRLYFPSQIREHYIEDVYVIMSDADMFIASSFLHRDFDKINVFGHDLTGFGQVPMCYVGMQISKWQEVMKYERCFGIDKMMENDLAQYADVNSEDFYKVWGADQDILTGKLKDYGFDKLHFINRGHDNLNMGLPMGRWDRHNWKKPEGEIHDVHLMRNPLSEENFPKIMEMCQTIYPKQDWGWLHEYRENFLGKLAE